MVDKMITLHVENIPFKLSNRLKLKTWIKQIATDEGKIPVDIACIFCSDERLLSMNKTFLKHDYLTDVITFDYSEDNGTSEIGGDIFISVDTVRANAQKYGVSPENELHRVIAHGVLHLCGYKDGTKREIQTMREKEDFYLAKKDDL